MHDLHRSILDAADALSSAHDHDSYIRVAAHLLESLIPGNHVLWLSSSFHNRHVVARGDRALLPYVDIFRAVGDTHPGVTSYQRRPGDVSPRRVSDVTSHARWRNSPAYQEICRPLNDFHQLNVLVRFGASGDWISWTISRSEQDSDFTEDHVVTARALQPLLSMAERLHAPPVDQNDRATVAGETINDTVPPLYPTPREAQVLALLAQGQTAAAIARRCGITPRTVRKHLENLYAKLGCSDRLLAVQRARERGWLRNPEVAT